MKKLRNKKTGEIIILIDHIFDNYKNLAEFKAEWEDYEEPTTYYYISDFGAIREGDVGKFVEDGIVRKQIGNYFETKEEAKKAVEKLEAWKRLKDKGFRFEGHSMLNYAPNDNYDYSPSIGFSIPELDKDEPYEYPEEIEKDLDICFGGEE